MSNYKIAASILSADFARLGEEIDNVLAAGADMIHFDVMDNHYVPNLTVGPLVCDSLRNYGIAAPIDVHLMVEPVDRLITDFAKAGATYITFHPEASQDVNHSLQLIHDAGCKGGLAFNPETSLDDLEIDKIDVILIMSINPGFAGQGFIPEVLPKITAARELIKRCKHEVLLEVDGGVKTENIKKIATAGADTFVTGSAIFKSADYAATISKMRAELKA
jgi:ribulose-phosphate 3-epimerase